MSLTDHQGRAVVGLARRTLERFTCGQELEVPTEWVEGYLNERRGIFVTLKKDALLRGCIGFPYPVKALGHAAVEATIGAAAYDPRFPRVTRTELPSILVEASILTVPQELRAAKATALPQHVRIGVDGLIVGSDGRSGLLLPQVATELNLTPEEFLSETCMKAGLPPDAWLMQNTTVQSFQAEVFSEESPGGKIVRQLPKED